MEGQVENEMDTGIIRGLLECEGIEIQLHKQDTT